MKSGTVTLIGRPNSGKSTLLNALIREKVSIVSGNPQTTRHRILGILTESRGQIVFVDTPGIHKPGYRMNQRMLQTALDSLRDVDLVLHVVDGSIRFGAGESFVLRLLKNARPKAFLLINKIDKFAKPRLLPIIDRYRKEYDFAEILPISALTRENLGLLVDILFKSLQDGDALFGPNLFTDRTERFLTAELIREKILERSRQELPYTTAVMIRKFDEGERKKRNLVRIEADIIVEKRSQQGIIIGKSGLTLRGLGSAARLDIEQLLGSKVHLGLRVRTVPRWRNNEGILDELELGR